MKVQFEKLLKSINFRDNINKIPREKVALYVSKTNETIYSLDAAKVWGNCGLNTYDYLYCLGGDWGYYKETQTKNGVQIEQSLFYGCSKITEIPNDVFIFHLSDIDSDRNFRSKCNAAGSTIEIFANNRQIFLDEDLKQNLDLRCGTIFSLIKDGLVKP